MLIKPCVSWASPGNILHRRNFASGKYSKESNENENPARIWGNRTKWARIFFMYDPLIFYCIPLSLSDAKDPQDIFPCTFLFIFLCTFLSVFLVRSLDEQFTTIGQEVFYVRSFSFSLRSFLTVRSRDIHWKCTQNPKSGPEFMEITQNEPGSFFMYVPSILLRGSISQNIHSFMYVPFIFHYLPYHLFHVTETAGIFVYVRSLSTFETLLFVRTLE